MTSDGASGSSGNPQDPGVSFPADAVDGKVKDLGLLIGLLQASGKSELQLNLEWFEDPVRYLLMIPDDRTDLLNLLRDFLGTPAEGTPESADWYSIDWNGKPSGIYVVLPKEGDDTSPVGVGLWHNFSEQGDDVQISVWLLAPLFNLPLGSPVIITGSATNPVIVALSIEDTKQKFTSGATTFTGLAFEGETTFSSAPSFELSFLDMAPPARSGQSTVKTLAELVAALDDISNWMNVVLDNVAVAGWLRTDIPSTDKTVGDVLVDLELLRGSAADGFTLGDFSSFEGHTPGQIAEELVAEALSLLASRTVPVVALGKGGIYVVDEDVSDGVTDYGLRLQVPDISNRKAANGGDGNGGDGNGGDDAGRDDRDADSTGGTAPGASGPEAEGNKPELTLQLGKWLTGESDDANWVKRSNPNGTIGKPGVSLYFIRETTSVPSFHARVELVSIGFDFKGSNDNPLIDVSGFEVGGFEPRFGVSLDFSQLGTIPWGLALRVDDVGLPLGTGLAGSSSQNPVAQNLLSSGSGHQGAETEGGEKEGAGADSAKVNPPFSAAISKTFDPANATAVSFQLYAADDQPTDKVWIPVGQAFGPLRCQRIGAEWPQPNADDVLSFLFDGGVETSALDVELKGLSVGIPLKHPGTLRDYTFGLEGLDFMLTAGAVEISGGLFESTMTIEGAEVTSYDGSALIKAGTWSIQAFGSWAELSGHPSLFVFAFIDATLGGPPVFFVTGLSAGFGYNRSLKLPGQNEVQDFPLVAGLTTPSVIGGKDATPIEALDQLQEFVPPAQGVNWVAAGVQFTSFELINSNALLVVEFGREFEIAVLGLSRIKLPQVGALTFAYAELELEVIFAPDEGVFSATAVLTPNSFVLDPACHLTGGFGFFSWFGSNKHAGDFVLTIGGYNALFKKPAWYPDEPRLGFNWNVSDAVTIKGSAYFALTPSCVMGGGALDVEFHAGPVRAWFTAHADFLIQWKPFYFIASIGVSIGVELRIHIWFIHGTLKLELGADLTLWGPPTGGIAHVHLWIISFSVSFGSKLGAGMDYLDYEEFATMLPSNNKPEESHPTRMLELTAAEASTGFGNDGAQLGNVCTIVLNAGQSSQQAPPDRWLVHADELVFTVQTAFPLTELDLRGPDGEQTKLEPPDPDEQYYVGVRPMGISSLTSVMSITVTYEPGTTEEEVEDLAESWHWSPRTGDVPEAVWGAPIPPDETPPAGAKILPDRLLGLQNVTPAFLPPDGPGNISKDNLAHDPINPDNDDYLPFPRPQDTIQPTPPTDTTLATIAATVDDDTTPTRPTSPVARRAALFAALAGLGYDAGSNGTMEHLKDDVGLSFPTAPMTGSPLGTPATAEV